MTLLLMLRDVTAHSKAPPTELTGVLTFFQVNKLQVATFASGVFEHSTAVTTHPATVVRWYKAVFNRQRLQKSIKTLAACCFNSSTHHLCQAVMPPATASDQSDVKFSKRIIMLAIGKTLPRLLLASPVEATRQNNRHPSEKTLSQKATHK